VNRSASRKPGLAGLLGVAFRQIARAVFWLAARSVDRQRNSDLQSKAK